MSNEQTMQKSRPQTSQAVIDGFTRIIDSQDEKGLAKYGRDIDDAKDKDWDWKLMALEEAADYSKYLIKEIKRLEAENEQYKKALRKNVAELSWNPDETITKRSVVDRILEVLEEAK